VELGAVGIWGGGPWRVDDRAAEASEVAAELEGAGSDRLVDAVVAWGDDAAVANRVREHHKAGADHVCVQVLTQTGDVFPRAEYRRLAEALLG
jgi:hypothetical protein